GGGGRRGGGGEGRGEGGAERWGGIAGASRPRWIKAETRPASAAGSAAPGRAASWSRLSWPPAAAPPHRNVEDGAQARGAERGEIVTLHDKTLSARLSPISQDGFLLRPLANARVSKCGGVRGVRPSWR